MKLKSVNDTAKAFYGKEIRSSTTFIDHKYHIYQLLSHLHHRIVNTLTEIYDGYDDDVLNTILAKNPDEIIALFKGAMNEAYDHYMTLKRDCFSSDHLLNSEKNRYLLWASLVEDILKFRLYCSGLKA